MKKTVFLIIASVFVSFTQLTAQQYTATEYWKMEHDTAFTRLIERQNAGDALSLQEQNTLAEYKVRLSEYFAKLSDNEKSLYYKNRSTWEEQPQNIDKFPTRQETDVFSGERSMYTQYLVSSGIFGALYGAAAVYILGLEDNEGLAVGIPLLTAGASVLIPVLTLKDKYVSYNSLSLTNHGRVAGALQGAALGALITGDNVEDGKLIIGLSTAASIGLGQLGYHLGKNQPWSQGRAALYSYYGLLMPFEGMAIIAACESEDPRIYGLTSLAFGAGGYLIANRIANSYDYTKGDVTATGTLAALNGLLGFMILTDMEDRSGDLTPAHFLIPAAGALGGTFAGHLWLKNAHLSSQQGRNVALASSGGVAIGLGLAALFTPESVTPYYVIPYITGMSTYALMVGIYKKKNILTFTDFEKKGRWDLNVMPQNIFLNNKIAEYSVANPGKRIDFLPAFSATFNF